MALGGGASFGNPNGGGVSLSGSVTFTLLRDIGDVAGHALTAGLSIGAYSMNAVWAVGADADALEQRQSCANKHDVQCASAHCTCLSGGGKSFIDQVELHRLAPLPPLPPL